MIQIIDKIEKYIYAALMILLVIVLIAGMADLVWVLYEYLVTSSPYLLVPHEAVSVLGAFLLVLIGVELLDMLKAYFRENTIHVEIVILLAIIAVARKVILVDPSEMTGYEYGFELIGIGVIFVGLAAGYYLIKKAGLTIGPDGVKKQP